MKLQHKNDCVLFRFWPDNDEAAGWFDEDNLHIYLAKKLNLYEREVIYFHERGHRKCFLSNCKCWGKKMLCEYHAMREELQQTILANDLRIAKAYHSNTIHFLNKCKENPVLWKQHLSAFKKLQKTKLYQEFERKINEITDNDNEP